tara:strand:- start:4282 stop:4473 length:192 start_codon:yes stop_codon:yes gene_type:complete
MKSTGQAPAAIVYEKAFNEVVNSLPKWKYDIMVNHNDDDPSWDRVSKEVVKLTNELAEERFDN